jgi:hypothetical protein
MLLVFVELRRSDPVYADAGYHAGTEDDGVFKSTNGGGSWSGVNFPGFPVFDPVTPTALYAGTVFQSTNSGGSWNAVNTGLIDNALTVHALVIDPITPSILYAGTSAGVFSIQQGAPCVGDCNDTHTVAINDIITLVNVALGNAQAEACPHGVPSGTEVNVALIIQAVNSALRGCSG